jgi:hypothetical protein
MPRENPNDKYTFPKDDQDMGTLRKLDDALAEKIGK